MFIISVPAMKTYPLPLPISSPMIRQYLQWTKLQSRTKQLPPQNLSLSWHLAASWSPKSRRGRVADLTECRLVREQQILRWCSQRQPLLRLYPGRYSLHLIKDSLFRVMRDRRRPQWLIQRGVKDSAWVDVDEAEYPETENPAGDGLNWQRGVSLCFDIEGNFS